MLAQSYEALDQAAAHKEYEDGNFESVITQLNDFQKQNPIHSKSDSLFIAKHLAVVYSANPKTIEIGKHWMYQLLKLLPVADLAGMYVNEEIDRVFDKVRREFIGSQYTFGVDTTKIVLPNRSNAQLTSTPSEKPNKNDSATDDKKKWIWIGAGSAVVVLTVTGIYILTSQSNPGKERTLVPVKL
jgi:hypothetical protein